MNDTIETTTVAPEVIPTQPVTEVPEIEIPVFVQPEEDLAGTPVVI